VGSKRFLQDLQDSLQTFHEDVYEQLIVAFAEDLSRAANEESAKQRIPIMKDLETIEYEMARALVGRTISDLVVLLTPLDQGYRSIFEAIAGQNGETGALP